MSMQSPASPAPWWHLYVPKSVICLKEGYSLAQLRDDLIAGITVAIVALPLSIALGIASGATPAKGLITVVIAGLVISLLSGCRFQIGGPAGAFVVIVSGIISTHGYDGLVTATLMAGVILILAGFARLGDWIKYIPQPVITGFTSGIALIIFSSQIPNLFGLHVEHAPDDFFGRLAAYWDARSSAQEAAVILSFGTVAVIVLLQKFAPRLPALLIAIIAASAACYHGGMKADTIGSVFGGIPDHLPAPHLPKLSLARLHELLPSALIIAFLAGVESLLCALVADGMSGRRHKSNCELVAQGAANFASALFGAMPATGTVARTATNIRAGARTPVSGIVHALVVLLFMLLLAPAAAHIPLAALGGVLVIVSWNMSERKKFATLLRGPKGDGLVLLTTFFLTVFVDLPTAIEVGVVMGAMLFMHRMAQTVAVRTGENIIISDPDDVGTSESQDADMRHRLPAGAEAFQFHGPLFFGVAARLLDALEQIKPPPRVFILRMSLVPMIDSSGAVALEEFISRCERQKIKLIISGLQPQPLSILRDMKIAGGIQVSFVDYFNDAIDRAKVMLSH